MAQLYVPPGEVHFIRRQVTRSAKGESGRDGGKDRRRERCQERRDNGDYSVKNGFRLNMVKGVNCALFIINRSWIFMSYWKRTFFKII